MPTGINTNYYRGNVRTTPSFAAPQPGSAQSPQSSAAQGTPVTKFSADVRTAFLNLGLSTAQVNTLEQFGIPQEGLQQLYDAIKADPSMVKQVPSSMAQFQAQLAESNGALTGASTAASAGAATSAAAMSGTSGPAAWNNKWHDRFYKLGLDEGTLTQLHTTGANGAGEADLKKMYETFKAQVDEVIAPFKKEYKKEYAKLIGWVKQGKVPPSAVIGVIGGLGDQLKKEKSAKKRDELVKMTIDGIPGQLKMATVDVSTTKGKIDLARNMVGTMGKGMFGTKEGIAGFAAWMLVPNWGAMRFALAGVGALRGKGAKEPGTGMKIELNPIKAIKEKNFMGLMDTVMAVGGAWGLYNAGKGLAQIHQGHQLLRNAAPGSKFANAIATNPEMARLSQLTGWDRFKSYLPRTKDAGALAALGRFDKQFDMDLKLLKTGAEMGLDAGKLGPRELAEFARDEMLAGRARIYGHTGLGANGLLFLSVKGKGSIPMIGNRSQKLIETKMLADGTQQIILNTGIRGKAQSAALAKVGAMLAPAGSLAHTPDQVMGLASQQMGLSNRSALSKIYGMIRPNALSDAVRAEKLLTEGALSAGKTTLDALKMATGKKTMLTIGASIATAYLGTKYIVPMIMPKPEAPTEDAAAEAEQAQGELTPEQQAEQQALAEQQAAAEQGTGQQGASQPAPYDPNAASQGLPTAPGVSYPGSAPATSTLGDIPSVVSEALGEGEIQPQGTSYDPYANQYGTAATGTDAIVDSSIADTTGYSSQAADPYAQQASSGDQAAYAPQGSTALSEQDQYAQMMGSQGTTAPPQFDNNPGISMQEQQAYMQQMQDRAMTASMGGSGY